MTYTSGGIVQNELLNQAEEGTACMDMVASYRDKLVSPGGPANRKLTGTWGQHLKQTRHRKNTGSEPEGTFVLLAICAQGGHSTGGPVPHTGRIPEGHRKSTGSGMEIS